MYQLQAGVFIPWENYIPRSQTTEAKAFYEMRDEQNDLLFIEGLNESDNESLASLTENNLVPELDAEVDAHVALNARAFTEQDYSPEADEVYDAIEENYQLVTVNIDDIELSSTDDSEIAISLGAPVLFAYNSSEIKPEYYQLLNETAQWMEKEVEENNTVWQVIGYADLSGNYIYNSKLAKKRAQNVAAYLIDKGVGEAQLSIASLGSSQPKSSERSVENGRNERRVEIHEYQTELALLIKSYKNEIAELEATKMEDFIVQYEASILEDQAMQAQIEKERTTDLTLVEDNNDKQETPTLEKELTEHLTTAMEL